MESQNSIVFIDELHTLVGAGSAEGSLDAANILKPALSRGEIQCIGAPRRRIPQVRGKGPVPGTPLPIRKVPAPNEEEAIQVISGVRERYEKFHAVSYTDEALRYSVYLSNRYIPDRFLPDKAIDLIDEAGARVKLRQASVPEEVGEVQKRVKFITHRMESAIAATNSRKRVSTRRRAQREGNLRTLRDRYKLDDASTGIVTREDIEEVVSRWTGIGVTSIKRMNNRNSCARAPNFTSASSVRTKLSPRCSRHSPQPRRTQIAAAPGRLLFLPGAYRRRKTESPGGWPNSSSVQKSRWSASTCPNSWRSTRSPTHRRASRLRRLRRGRPTHRARPPHSVLGHPPRRNREGSSGRVQHPVAGFEDGQLTDGLGTPSISATHHHDLQSWRAALQKRTSMDSIRHR